MCDSNTSSATEHFNKLIQFRQAAYELLGNACDAQIELTDAVIQMRQIQSFAELSCAPAFRRKWSSAYEALQDGRPNRSGLMRLYLEQLGKEERVVLAGDHTAWPHLWTETLAGRSYQHQPTPIPGRRPVTIGHGYSTVAVIPEMQGSWALPLLHERIPNQKPVEAAATQLRQVCGQLPMRAISLWDSEYSCAAFVQATHDIPVDKLVRLRSNLCLEGPPKPPKGKRKPPKHGFKFKLNDPTTWWKPDEQIEYGDPKFGTLTVRVWRGLRFSGALEYRMTVAQVERPLASGSRRQPKTLWFSWLGGEPSPCWWTLYSRRYPLDHWYRFAKGRLHWTLPRLATPEQCDRWSDLMPFITWELWLARQLVKDCPLPWQKPQLFLPPGRVCQSMQNILVAIGTPSRVCKSRGVSPGWPKGRPRAKRERHPLIRSERWKVIRARKQSLAPGQKAKKGRPKRIPSPIVA